MVVPIPHHDTLSVAAVVDSHRRLLRLAREDTRRWLRTEPPSVSRYGRAGRPASEAAAIVSIAPYLAEASSPY